MSCGQPDRPTRDTTVYPWEAGSARLDRSTRRFRGRLDRRQKRHLASQTVYDELIHQLEILLHALAFCIVLRA